MGLEDFKQAYEALPDKVDAEDILDFVAGVVVSYMPPKEAIQTLLKASVKVAEFAAEYGSLHTECECNACVEKREAEKPKH